MPLAELSSERLRFRQVTSADRDVLNQMLTDPLQVANEGTQGDADWFLQSWGRSTWIAHAIDDARPIGFVTLEVRDGMGNLGYGVLAGGRGQRFATEMAHRITQHGFGDLGLKHVFAQCADENAPSVRILLGLGMSRSSRNVVNAAGRTEFFYIVSAADYADRQRQPPV